MITAPRAMATTPFCHLASRKKFCKRIIKVLSVATKTKDDEKAEGKALLSEDAVKKLVPNLHNLCNGTISNTKGVCTTEDNGSRISDADY